MRLDFLDPASRLSEIPSRARGRAFNREMNVAGLLREAIEVANQKIADGCQKYIQFRDGAEDRKLNSDAKDVLCRTIGDLGYDPQGSDHPSSDPPNYDLYLTRLTVPLCYKSSMLQCNSRCQSMKTTDTEMTYSASYQQYWHMTLTTKWDFADSA